MICAPRHPCLKRAALMMLVAGCCALRGAEIHEAAELGNLGKIKQCLAQDPTQLHSVDAKGRTLLGRAALSAKKEMVDYLLDQGATEDIYAAAVVGHADKVASFLQADPKLVRSKDACGKAALHWAALYGQREVMELLLAAPAEVNMLDEGGFTALHWAAMFDRSEVAELLLAHKADTTIKVEKFGWTPLRLAVLHGRVATAGVLLKGGADPNLPDKENIPLLHQAIILGKKEMVELLLAHKAEINQKDADGETPMGEALEQGNKEMIEFLRERGAKEK